MAHDRFRELRALLVVARERSFTKAGDTPSCAAAHMV